MAGWWFVADIVTDTKLTQYLDRWVGEHFLSQILRNFASMAGCKIHHISHTSELISKLRMISPGGLDRETMDTHDNLKFTIQPWWRGSLEC